MNCNHTPAHSERWDALFCTTCRTWLEPACDCNPDGSPLLDGDMNEIAGTHFVCPYIGRPADAKDEE